MRPLAHRPRAALLAVLALAACAGITARQKVMLPAMAQAWTSIADEVTAGVAADLATGKITAGAASDLAAARDAMTAAMTSGEPAAIAAVNWSALRVEAEAGIASELAKGKIGPGVAESLRARIRGFSEDLAKYLERS